MSESSNPRFSRHDKLGSYEIVRFIGKGGMGEVYLARDPALDRHVALKIINNKVSSDSEVKRRFSQEGKALARLRHPCLVTVFNVGDENGDPYLAMEYVEGLSLGSYLEHGTFGIGEALHLLTQIVDGVVAAHKSGVIHRDLKPANIIIDEDHRVKIIDFGIARVLDSKASDHTSGNIVLGTIHYLAPEVAKGQALGVQTDIYAMGVIFYEMLTGQRPFTGTSNLELIEKIKCEPIKFPPSISALIPQPIQDMILKMTAKDVKDRFQSAHEILVDIRKLKLADWPTELQKVWPRCDIENETEVRAHLKNQGFDTSEFSLIIHLAWQIQNREATLSDDTMNLSESEAKLKMEALDQGIGQYKKAKQRATDSLSYSPVLPKIKQHHLWRAGVALTLVAAVGIGLRMMPREKSSNRAPAAVASLAAAFTHLDDEKNYRIKAFKGPEGERVTILFLDETSDPKKVLIKFSGVGGPLEGKIFAHTLEEYDNKQDYRLIDEDYVTVTLRHGKYNVYPKGSRSQPVLTYLEDESNRLHPGALVREFSERQ